jgi:general secretion pathway protein B
MSLILDALRRADSERDRGAVPGLHAQPLPVPAPEAAAGDARLPWAWIAAAAGVALLAALAWIVAGRGVAPPAGIAATAAVTAAPVPPPPPAVATAVAPSPPPAAAVPVVPSPRLEPQPVAEPAPWPAPPAERRAAEATPAVAPSPAAAPVAPVASAAAAQAAPVVAREQLPQDIRAQLPPLVLGGSIYSSNAADRTLIVDGRILREKGRVSADLTLEQIRPKSAVFSFRGQRFEVGY